MHSSDIAAWESDPYAAFTRLLETPEFIETGNARFSARAHTRTVLKKPSMKVYQFMFARLLTWFASRPAPVSFVTATPADVAQFFDDVFATTESEIRWRYLRLIERTYECLVNARVRETNPATQCVLGLIEARGRKAVLGRDADTEALPAALRSRVVAELEKLRLSDAWKDHRDAALVAVMLGAGLKLAEALELRRRHVLREANGLAINVTEGVGTGKERRVRVSDFAVLYIAHWLASPIGGECFFPGSKAAENAMDASTAYRRVRRILELAKGDDAGARHMGGRILRNSYGVELLTAGVSEDKARQLLGLREESSVKRYKRAAKRSGGPDKLADADQGGPALTCRDDE